MFVETNSRTKKVNIFWTTVYKLTQYIDSIMRLLEFYFSVYVLSNFSFCTFLWHVVLSTVLLSYVNLFTMDNYFHDWE